MQVTVKAFAVVPSRSGVLRPQAEREVLNLFGARMAAVALSGYIFFGSSLSISDQVAPATLPFTLPHNLHPPHLLVKCHIIATPSSPGAAWILWEPSSSWVLVQSYENSTTPHCLGKRYQEVRG